MTASMQKLDFQLKIRPALYVLALFLCLWFIPCPAGVDPKGWKVFAVFVSTIFGFLMKPMPLGALVLTAITVLAATKALTLKEALSGFGNGSVWLIVMAFFIGRGFIKTGLGNRIAYIFIHKLGHTSLGLAYAFSFTNYIMAPAMPSSTARSGTICPLVVSVAKTYGSDPEKGTARKIGAFLIFAAFQTNYPTGAAFMTAMAGNPLAAGFAADQGVTITWLTWWWGNLVPALLSLLSVPLALYYLYPPKIKKSPEARDLAARKLEELGPMTLPEKVMLFAFFLLLFLWVVGAYFGLDATVAALIGIVFLIFAGVLTWQDVLSEKGAYDCLVWFSGLIMMAGFLNKFGVIKWITTGLSASIVGFPWPVILLLLCCASMYIAYCFASSTAVIGAVYAAYLGIALAAGAPPVMAALAIAAFCNLQACLTYYSGGSAPIFYGTGYVESGDWLKFGFLMSVLHLIVWGVVGGVWWKIIGLY